MKPSLGVRRRSLIRLGAVVSTAITLGALSGCIVARPPEFARTAGKRTTEEKIAAKTEELREEFKAKTEAWKKEQAQKEAKTEAKVAAKVEALQKERLYRDIESQVNATTRELRFASGSYEVPFAAQRELKRLAQFLAMPGAEDAKIRLEGYSDSKGSETTNLRLSQQRAQAVRQILLENGAHIAQFEVEGRGTENPVASNRTESGRAQNRRVEMEVSGIPTG